MNDKLKIEAYEHGKNHGTIYNSFNDITNKDNIKKLYIYKNSNGNITDECFNNMINLEILYIRNYSTNRLPNKCFDNLINLKDLKLEGFINCKLPSNWFDLPNLDKLINLRTLTIHGKFTLKEHYFNNLLKLEKLNLACCEIDEIPKLCFNDLNNLIYLELDRNRITNIPSNCLDNQQKLKYLSLSNNKIEIIPDDLFANLINIENIFLYGNYLKNISNNKIEHLNVNYGSNYVFGLNGYNSIYTCGPFTDQSKSSLYMNPFSVDNEIQKKQKIKNI